MDIQLTEEQELLRSSIQRFLRDQYDFDERRKIVATDEGWSRKHWKSFAELGLCAAPFQESSGGLGGGSLATMIVMQEFGRNLVVEPLFRDGCSRRRSDRGRRLAGAARRSSCPRSWRARRYGRWPGRKDGHVMTSTTSPPRRGARGTNYVLSGTKAAVIGAPWADKLIVSARTSGGPRDRVGVSLFVVDRHSRQSSLAEF